LEQFLRDLLKVLALIRYEQHLIASGAMTQAWIFSTPGAHATVRLIDKHKESHDSSNEV
jgi:hypothetical protein